MCEPCFLLRRNESVVASPANRAKGEFTLSVQRIRETLIEFDRAYNALFGAAGPALQMPITTEQQKEIERLFNVTNEKRAAYYDALREEGWAIPANPNS